MPMPRGGSKRSPAADRPPRRGCYTAQVSAQPDLQRHIARRRLRNYEQAMARLTYAYGVDVRRSRWLAGSTIGNSLVRAIDRRWPSLTAELMENELRAGQSPQGEVPTDLLQRIGRLRHLLRAPLPALRVLTPSASASGNWPLVTPLGPTHGDVHWLVLDLEGLGRLSSEQLDFLLGSGLGHLQCDHGVYFTGHLLAHRREGLGLSTLRTVLSPWSKVMVFSADRAGMLAVGDLGTTLEVMRSRAESDEAIGWLPRWPSFDVRRQALEEFDRSVVMARLRAIRSRAGEDAEISVFEPPPRAEEDGAEEPSEPAPAPEPAPATEEVGIPEDAWSLARCDARLTERLRLL